MGQKLWFSISAVAVVAAGAALGGSYYMGGRIQQGFAEGVQRANQGPLKIEVVNYSRGALSSQAQTRWTYDIPGSDSIQFLVDHTIDHGPWPKGNAAQVHSRFALPEDAGEELKTAFAGKPPFELSTTVGWNRTTSNLLTSPAATFKKEDSSFAWEGMRAEWDMPADLKAAQGTIHFPSFTAVGTDGNIAFKKVEFKFDVAQHQGYEFWTGPFSMQIDEAGIRPNEGDGEAALVQGVSFDSDSRLKADVLESWLKTKVKSVQLGESKASDVNIDMAFKNLDAQWFNATLQYFQSAHARAMAAIESDDDEAASDVFPADTLELLTKNIEQALARQPEIELKNFSLQTPEGSGELSALVRYAGDGKNLGTILQDIQASVKTALPESMLRSIIESRGKQSALAWTDETELSKEQLQEMADLAKAHAEERITELKESGTLQKDQNRLLMQLELSKGELQLNGKPIDGSQASLLASSIL